MPLDPYEINSLYLSGTIRIPHNPPSTGDRYLIRQAIPGTQEKQGFLRIVQEIHDGLRLTFLVRLKDVRAVKLSDASEIKALGKATQQKSGATGAPPPAAGARGAPRILLSEYLEEVVKSSPPGKSDADELWITGASVYLPEGAPVHVQTHAGVSAAESAEFHPRALSMRASTSTPAAAAVIRPCDTHFRPCDPRP